MPHKDLGHTVLLSLERFNRLIFAAASAEDMLDSIVREMLSVFDCDRAWLIYPCDPNASEITVVHECARPPYPSARGLSVPVDAAGAARLRLALEHEGRAVRSDPESHPIPTHSSSFETHGVRSSLFTVLRPSYGKPWLFGIHHCREARVYSEVVPLFSAVAARVRDGLQTSLAQRALRESEERFRLLVEHAPDAIVIFDADTGRFADVNDQAVELFGLPRKTLLGLGPAEVSPKLQADGRSSAELAPALIAAALNGQAQTFEWLHADASGQAIECEVRLLRLPHPERRWVRGSITCIAERKRAAREHERLTAQLFRAQKMQAIGQLTGGVAHDFNNLLTVVGGALALIELDADDPVKVRSVTAEAVEACQRAAELTRHLLAFSRQQPLRPQTLDIGPLVRGLEPLFRRTLGETIRQVTAVAPDVWCCEADPAQLENALLNLALNARDAMPNGGCLTIEVANVVLDANYAGEIDDVKPGDYVMLAVTDDGTGIPSDVLSRVHEPFFTTKEVGKGSGLGLSMVYGFAKQSGGHLKIYSELGHGTTVKLFLPRSDSDPSPLARSEGTEPLPHGAGEHVLVVEDDESLRSLVVKLLHRCGYRTLEAADAHCALELLARESDIALLLSDVVLPEGVNGTELSRRAALLRPTLPVLYMSGYTENAIIHNGRLDPGVQLLEKPFTLATLARAVKAALLSRS